MGLKTLIKLEVFKVMANVDIEKDATERGLYSTEEIVSRMHVSPNAKMSVSIALDRIFRVITSHGVVRAKNDHDTFNKHPTRKCGLNLVSQYFVNKSFWKLGNSYTRPSLMVANPSRRPTMV